MRRAAIGLALALTIGAATDAAAEPRLLARALPLVDAQLADQRGGLRTPDGLEFGFGAVVRTFVDGALALQTEVTWTDQGPVEQTRAVGAEGPASASTSGWQGLVLPGDGGSTTVLHQLDGDGVRNVILNTANNRGLRQETEVTLNVPALAELQRDAVAAQMNLRLDEAVAAALADAAVR